MLIENKKVKFDYEIVESYEAGIQLTGSETKSILTGVGSLAGARVVFREDGAYVIGMTVPKYKFDSSETYVPDRVRKLLMHRHEIVAIGTKMKSAGLTFVPVKLYNKGRLIKVQVALVRGKKKFEKREIIKKREVDRGLARRLKNSI